MFGEEMEQSSALDEADLEMGDLLQEALLEM